jgi:hypothetical protein
MSEASPKRKRGTSPGLLLGPLVDLLARGVLLDAVTLLDLAFELVALSADGGEVVVGQIAPLLLELPLELLSVSFDTIPVHGSNS